MTTINSRLVENTELQVRLPDHLLHSEDYYCTQDAYEILLSFEAEDELEDLFNQNQVSDGLIQEVDLEIDRLFKLYLEPDTFSPKALRELRSYISNLLDGMESSTLIIK